MLTFTKSKMFFVCTFSSLKNGHCKCGQHYFADSIISPYMDDSIVSWLAVDSII